MQAMGNPVTQSLELLKERKQITLTNLAYRLGLSQREVLKIIDVLERERAVRRSEDQGEIVVHLASS